MSEFDAENFDPSTLIEAVKRLQAEQENDMKILAEKKKAYTEAENALRALWRENNEISRRVEARRSELRQTEKEADRLRRLQLAREKRNQAFAEFEEKAKEIDALTASAKWREFAFDHQISGGKRLAVAKRGILADKRGLGKTLTSLVWLDMVQAKRILVIAPNDIVPQFEDEIREWAPARKIFSLRGLNPTQRSIIYPMLNMVQEFIITLNYEAWRRDKTIIDDLVSAGIDTIICDEAHKIKSSTKITARGVFQLAYRPNHCKNCGKSKNYMGPWVQGTGLPKDYNVNEMMLQCPDCNQQLGSTVENVLTMTGTPILNKPQELFSMLYLVDCSRFSTEREFLSDYCYNYAPNRWKFMSGGLDRLTKSMSEFFIQRNRDEAGIHIPPPAIKIYYIDKDKTKYKKQYEAERLLRNNAALILENGDAYSMLYILEIMLRERQIMTWPAGVELKIKDEDGEVIDTLHFDVEESQKLDEACELLSDLVEEDERVLVFSKFKAPLYEMRNRFPDVPMIVATGDQHESLRRQVVQDFDLKTAPESPRWKVCFATYDAFGTGLNLNAARHVILLDDEWSPGMEDQAIGRIDRMNSTDQANVHIFRVKDSIDEFMEALIEEKRQLTEGFEGNFDKQRLLDHLRGAN
jgi:SNF2 family DNA or RNA helicase